MQVLLEKMNTELKIRNYSQKTIKLYTYAYGAGLRVSEVRYKYVDR